MKNKITSAWVVRRPDRTNLSGYSHRKFNTEEEARKFAEGKDNCEVYEQEDYNTPRLENYGWKKPVTSAHQDKMWRGVPGVEMIWHGEWSDPELEYEGTRRNYWDVEDAMYEWAKEDGIDTENDEEFNRYCQEHAYDVYECFSSCGKKKGKKKPVKSDWKREAEFMNDRIRDDNLLYQVFKIEDEHFGGNFENPDNWDGTHIVYTIENGEITNTEIVDSFEDVIDDGNKYYLSADRDTGYRNTDYVLDRVALWQERNNRGITSSRKPVKSGITYDQALDMFTSEGKPWGDYWEMQQDWEAYKDGLVRDGQVEYEEERWWDNPCTPDTFKSWIESSKKPIQSMIIHQEITFDDFEPWSGARDTYERIMKADLGDEFDALITELYPDGCTETQINDILWFDADWVYECLGMPKEDEDDDGIEPIDSGCHGKSKKGKKKAVKSSMSVRDLPREALQELKQRYYQEMTGDDLSYGEMAAIDDIVTDEEVFDEYDGTNFTEDDFFCLAK